MPRMMTSTLAPSTPWTVALEGDLDLWTQPRTRSRLMPLTRHRYGIVDLRAAQLGDATALGDLASVGRHNAALGGTIVVVAASAMVLRVLKLVCLDELFPIATSMAQAQQLIAAAQRRTAIPS